MKKHLTTMYDSVCAQKELLELLIEKIEAEESEQSQIKDEPRELIKGVSGLADFLACGNTKAQNIINSGILQEPKHRLSCRKQVAFQQDTTNKTVGGGTRDTQQNLL